MYASVTMRQSEEKQNAIDFFKSKYFYKYYKRQILVHLSIAVMLKCVVFERECLCVNKKLTFAFFLNNFQNRYSGKKVL